MSLQYTKIKIRYDKKTQENRSKMRISHEIGVTSKGNKDIVLFSPETSSPFL